MVKQNQTKEHAITLLKKMVIAKCIQDPNFKQQFLSKPADTIKKEFKIQLPKEVEIECFEDTDNKIHIVIPSKSVVEMGEAKHAFELSEEEQKELAGGMGAFENWFWTGVYKDTNYSTNTGGYQAQAGDSDSSRIVRADK